MESNETDGLIFARFFSDEDFYGGLEEICKIHKIESAVILSGLGQLKDFELGYFKEKGDYTPKKISKPHEIIGLTGSVSLQNEGYAFHIHASLSGEDKSVVGGHLIKGTFQVLGEVILMKSKVKVFRRIDEETGLNCMHLK